MDCARSGQAQECAWPRPPETTRRVGHPLAFAGDGAGTDGFGNFGRNQSSSFAGTRPGQYIVAVRRHYLINS